MAPPERPDESGVDLARALQQGQAEALGSESPGTEGPSLLRALLVLVGLGGLLFGVLEGLAPPQSSPAVKAFEVPAPTGLVAPIRQYEGVLEERARLAADAGAQPTATVAP